LDNDGIGAKEFRQALDHGDRLSGDLRVALRLGKGRRRVQRVTDEIHQRLDLHGVHVLHPDHPA